MQENNLEGKTVKRPWQANVWIILILGINFIFLIYFLFILYQILNTPVSMTNDNDLGFIFIFSVSILTVAFLSVIFIINSIISFGFYKGLKAFSFLSVFISFLILIFILLTLFKINGVSFFGMFLLFFASILLYLSVFCLKHQFYNQKKVK